MKKQKLPIPEFRLLQAGTFDYTAFFKAIEKATRSDTSLQ